MPYDIELADRVRLYLGEVPRLKITEKTMFRGLAFLVNGKMCVNISGNNLMCRIDPERHDEVSKRKGFMPMIMKGREMNGYCYVSPEGFKLKRDFEYWMQLCLEFNPSAKASKKSKSSKNNELSRKTKS
ncbi:MAG: TfoX/Sxy family protein [Chryseolinea sp.]